MQIGLDEVKHISTLARVKLTDSDMKQMQAHATGKFPINNKARSSDRV